MALNTDKLSIESLQVGELGDRLVEVHESILDLSIDLSADMVSQLTFRISDPYLKLHNNNYFMIGRTVTYGEYKFEIAAVDLKFGGPAEVNVTARSQATQKLRREKGNKNFGSISPTTFASQAAARVGLSFFGEDSPADGQIKRVQKDNQDESTFDMLKSLAGKNEFRFFEANNTMFFASEEFIVQNQGKFEIHLDMAGLGTPSRSAFFPSSGSVRRTSDGEKAATANFQLLPSASAFSIYPGSSFNITGVENFTQSFMVDRVEMRSGANNMVRISATAVEETPDSSCSTQTFRLGVRGSDCVKRIQQAVGTIVDGWWGPLTNAAVLRFQQKNGLPADAIWNADDWAKLEGKYVRPNSSFQPTTPASSESGGEVTISDVWYADKKYDSFQGSRYIAKHGKLPLPYPYNSNVTVNASSIPHGPSEFFYASDEFNEYIPVISYLKRLAQQLAKQKTSGYGSMTNE